MALTLRQNSAGPLSWEQMDANLTYLQTLANTANQNADTRQPASPKLSALASSVWLANQMFYTTGDNTLGMTNLSAFGRDLIAAETLNAARTVLSLQNVNNTADADKPVSTLVQAALATKVDKVDGMGLSATSFTEAEKNKLAGLESSHYRGLFVTLEALQAGVIAPIAGDYGDVDPGAGTDIVRYIWDVDDAKWVAQSGVVPPLTAAQVKALYESNPDTQAFHDADRTKLDGIAAGASATATNEELRDRATHTGTQLSSTISDFASAVRDTLLAGLSVGTNAAIVAGDTVLGALAKLQAQVSARLPLAGGTMTGPINHAAAVSLAVAATLNLDALASQSIEVTGTGTTITAISTGLPDGAVRQLRFSGASNILNNTASVATPGGQPLYLTPGDVVTIRKVGASQWAVIDYYRGDGSLFDYAQPISTTSTTLDLSAVTARSVVVTLANDVTTITLPTYAATRKYRRLELVVVNSGNFKLSGWPVGTVFEAGAAQPAKTGVGARTNYQISKIDSLSWFMYGSSVGGGELSVRGPNGNRLFLPGAITGGILTNASQVVNLARFIPFSVSRPMRVKQLSIRVGTANAGNSTMAIYNNDGDLTGRTDLPGTQLASTTVGGVAHTAAQNSADCACVLQPGVLYWIAWAPSIATALYHYPLLQTQSCMGYNSGLTTFCAFYTQVNVGNALPATVDTSTLVEAVTLRPALYIIEDIS